MILYPGSPAKFHKGPHTDLLRTIQPDVTQTVTTIQNRHTLDKPNNNHISHNGTLTHNGTLRSNASMFSDKEPIYSNIEPVDTNTLNTQKSLLLMEAPPTPVKTDTQTPPPLPQPHTDTDTDNHVNRQSVVSTQLPSNIDIEALAVATLTPAGGRISLPESGRWSICME